ncbi:MAG TPA: hypothetical protein PLS90_12110, partial [Candidatus Sumerlaeota bacterium]|nr:hypothetical protein [Candidatus Sumerlaeota bacterium]
MSLATPAVELFGGPLGRGRAALERGGVAGGLRLGGACGAGRAPAGGGVATVRPSLAAIWP